MTGTEELISAAEADPISSIEKNTPDTPLLNASDAAVTSDNAAAANSAATTAEIDIPLPRPVTELAPELRDPVDTFIADQKADEAVVPVTPKPAAKKREVTREDVCQTLANAAQDNGLPVPFLIRLIWQESGFNPNAVSRVGVQVMAQFMPGTARLVGLDNPFDLLQALPAAAKLLRDLVQQFGNLGLAAAAYNAGPKRIVDWLSNRGKLPKETRGYVTTITGQAPEKWTTANAQATATVPVRAPCQREAQVAALNGSAQAPQPGPSPQLVHLAQSPKSTLPAVALLPRKSNGRMTAMIRVAARSRGGRTAQTTLVASAKTKSATAKNQVAKAPARGAKNVRVAMAAHRR